jgi:3-hydroxyisobutyrate dehydrogenase-like beta-hydroxyacid dehydrogenase
MTTNARLCLLGFGEVGQTLAADLLARGVSTLCAYDILFHDAHSGPRRAAATMNVRAADSARAAAEGADVVVSAVTAEQDVAAARSVVQGFARDAFFLDLNSVSPGVKQRVAEVVEAAGARYVEAAIMAPIAPKRIASPMLFGGPHAAAFLPLACELGFAGAQVFSDLIGRASAAKMCRSVVIKGMEALLAESLLTARRYGVEDAVIDSLQNLFPASDWRTLARYMISRSLIHGRRRAEEMREVARTVDEAGVQPWMSRACAQRQEWAAEFRGAAATEPLEPMLDQVLSLAGAEKPRC